MERNALIQKFHGLLCKTNLMKEKEAILSAYGVLSTKDLSDEELKEAVERLTLMADAKSTQPSAVIRRLRSSILGILQDMGIYNGKGDWAKVNAFLMDPRICGQLLYELDEAALKALQKKLFSIYSKWRSEKDALDRAAKLN